METHVFNDAVIDKFMRLGDSSFIVYLEPNGDMRWNTVFKKILYNISYR